MKEFMFLLLSVCLSVCPFDYSKCYERIFMKFLQECCVACFCLCRHSYGRNFFYSILMKFCVEVMGPKSRRNSLGVKVRWPLPYCVPIFHSRNAFSMRRSEHHCIEALGSYWPARRALEAATRTKLKNATTPYFVPKAHKWGSMHFLPECAWLNEWCKISQQPSEISDWFQKTTYRKECGCVQGHFIRCSVEPLK